MTKLLPNRISETMSDAQIKQFKEAIRLAYEVLPQKPIMAKEDFDRIPKKAVSRIKEANLRIKIVRKYPKFLPPVLSLQDVENDNILHQQITMLNDDALHPLVELVEFVLGLCGGEEINAYSRFMDNMRKAKIEGDPLAIEADNEWDAVDKLLGLGSYKKTPTKTTDKPLKNTIEP